MPKEIFIVRNWITLQAAILDRSEAATHSHLFSKISSENTGGIVLLLVKLTVQSSDCILKWLHQECFLENLLKAFGAPKQQRL